LPRYRIARNSLHCYYLTNLLAMLPDAYRRSQVKRFLSWVSGRPTRSLSRESFRRCEGIEASLARPLNRSMPALSRAVRPRPAPPRAELAPFLRGEKPALPPKR
jgi:hypothetical protein